MVVFFKTVLEGMNLVKCAEDAAFAEPKDRCSWIIRLYHSPMDAHRSSPMLGDTQYGAMDGPRNPVLIQFPAIAEGLLVAWSS